jgi:titin
MVTVISSTQVDLKWADNSSREDGYHIQRASDAAFTKDLVTFTVTPDIASYSDTSLSPATTYYYRVTAFGLAGDSAPTNLVQVTTP